MLLALASLWLPLKPLDYPERPIGVELERGVQAYVRGKGLERLYLEDRQVVGTWFDGSKKRDVDQVLWISPSLLSRWLGYLAAKEKWAEGELPARWAKLRASLGGKLTFLVRLGAMPKIDLMEQETVAPGSSRDALDVRFLWTSTAAPWPHVAAKEGFLGWSGPKRFPSTALRIEGLRTEPRACRIGERRARSAEGVLVEDWWRRVPFGEPLTPEFERGNLEEGLPLGEFFATTYLVQLPVPGDTLPGGQFELRIFSPRKERIAGFSVFANGEKPPRR